MSLRRIVRFFYQSSPIAARVLEPILRRLRKYISLQNKKTFQIDALRAMLREEPVVYVTEFQGAFEISRESDIFVRVLAERAYEPDLVKVLMANLDRTRDAIDVGANVGFYSVLLAKEIATRRVLAIEPHPVIAARLARNLFRNDVANRVIIFEGLAADACSVATLRSSKGREEYASAGQLLHPQVAGSDVLESIEVPSQSLDALVALYGLDVGVIKIDVEGMEFGVLKGAKNLLEKYRPVILSELSQPLLMSNGSSAMDVVRYIESFGYQVIDPLYPNMRGGFREYGDILCLPK